MKRLVSILVLLSLVVALFSCYNSDDNSDDTTLVDDRGNGVHINEKTKIAALHASFADCWLLSGGSLVGVTEDAISDHNIKVSDNVFVIGTAKTVDKEKLIASGAEVAFLSLDLTAHLEIEDDLSELGIKCAFFRIDSFSDYESVMRRFCSVTGREDLYKINVIDVASRIESIKAKIPENEARTVLLMRAYSSGIKAKKEDNIAGLILKEFGLCNIADVNASMLEDMSLEYIIKADPDFIFVLTMGSEAAAREYLSSSYESNAAWRELTAVKNGNYHILPKELYHYKPCERWDESYEYLAKIIYKEIFP